MKKLIALIAIIALLTSAYFLLPSLKKEQVHPEKSEVVEKEVSEESEKVEESEGFEFKPIKVSSKKGFELWYNGYAEGIVNSFPSYFPTDTSDFIVYNLEYNDKSIILTWEQKRGTLNWINLKIFKYEKLVFNQTSNESKGRIEYVHNDPLHHHSPSVSYSFERKEPGVMLHFNITNRQNESLKLIIERVIYNGSQSFELASENFIFGKLFEIPPHQKMDIVLSYPNTTPPRGEIKFFIKYPERAGKLSYETLKLEIT